MEEEIDIGDAIWEEMTLAKTYTRHIQMYNDRQRKWKRNFNYAMLFIAMLLSVAMVIVNDKFKSYAAYAAIASMIIDKIREPFKLWFQPDEELATLDDMANRYASYLTNLEDLNTRFTNGYLKSEDTITSFYKYKSETSTFASIVNKYMRFAYKKITAKAQTETTDYLNNRFSLKKKETDATRK